MRIRCCQPSPFRQAYRTGYSTTSMRYRNDIQIICGPVINNVQSIRLIIINLMASPPLILVQNQHYFIPLSNHNKLKQSKTPAINIQNFLLNTETKKRNRLILLHKMELSSYTPQISGRHRANPLKQLAQITKSALRSKSINYVKQHERKQVVYSSRKSTKSFKSFTLASNSPVINKLVNQKQLRLECKSSEIYRNKREMVKKYLEHTLKQSLQRQKQIEDNFHLGQDQSLMQTPRRRAARRKTAHDSLRKSAQGRSRVYYASCKDRSRPSTTNPSPRKQSPQLSVNCDLLEPW